MKSERTINVFFLFIFIIFLNLSNCQILRDKYPHIFNEDSVNRQYPNGYYDRYHPQDRYIPREKLNPVGLDFTYSDSRCGLEKLQNFASNNVVEVVLKIGNIVGSYAYLCDGPGVSEYDRPSSKINTTPKIYRNLTIFLGIPYANPPLGELRFRPPQVYPSFQVKRANQYRSACPQHSQYTGQNKGLADVDEDCLYLNVFSPSVKRNQVEKYAVMVYIHGGYWDHGSANTFPAQMLAASQEVVVVTFNYRLGALGFFSTGENSSAGNFGLLDQTMAIEWVYDNIEAFNGDNKRITLFGPDVGAASATFHALSTRLGKKIARVIAQSGSAVADWAVINDNYTVFNNSLEYASLFNCHFQSPLRTVNCLRTTPINLLKSTVFQPKVGWLPWSPVIDVCTREEKWRLLPDIPENMIKFHYENLNSGFAYMSGITKDEAAQFLWEDLDLRKHNVIISQEKFRNKIHEYTSMLNYTLDIPSLVRAIEFMYFPEEKDIHNQTLMREGYINMLSDSYYTAPNDKINQLFMERNIPIYMYVLNSTLEGLQSASSYYTDILKNVVPHNIEYYMITGAPFMDPELYPTELNLRYAKWTEADRNISQFMMMAWANFAKFGNPTPVKLFDNILWERMNLKSMQYLSINTTNFTSVMMSSYRQKESQFWNSFLPTLTKQDRLPSTYCRPEYESWETKKHAYEASLLGVLAAIILCLFLCVLCSCLYCRAKSKHIVHAEDIPDTLSVTPSSIDTLLHMKRGEASNKYLAERLHADTKHTQV